MKVLKKMNKQKGFTLIELIVVIAVIAILAAILFPRFTGFSDSAKEKAVLSDARNIAVAVQAIIAEDGTIGTDATAEAAVETYTGTNFSGTLDITSVTGDFTYSDATRNYRATYVGATGVFNTAKITP